jgi:hypothetical protein
MKPTAVKAIVVALFGAFLALAQETLTNDAILKMVKSGLGDGLIISMIQSQPGKYSVTPDELLRLKQAGVPESVLSAMVKKTSATGATPSPIFGANPSGATPSAGLVAAGDPNDPMTPHDSGIWLYTQDREGKPQMIVLERAAYQGGKIGGFFSSALTYGIKKIKSKAVLPGPHAGIRIAGPNPVFYFYFEDKPAGLGKSYFGVASLPNLGVASLSNPNQFALIKLNVTKSNRETIIGQFGITGGSFGTNEKSMVGFKSERIRTGLYKVTVSSPLPEGEYCFLASSGAMGPYGAGAAGAIDIFDFGVSPD